jgi:hypothetical protein
MQDAGLMLSAYMIYFQLKERESKRGTWVEEKKRTRKEATKMNGLRHPSLGAQRSFPRRLLRNKKSLERYV